MSDDSTSKTGGIELEQCHPPQKSFRSSSRVKPHIKGIRTRKHAQSAPVHEWRSFKLQPWFFAIIITIAIGFLAGLIALRILSAKRNGFVHLHQQSSAIGRYVWAKGLLWTSMPTLLLSIYRLAFDAVVFAMSERQPYIELEQGAIPHKSIFLDYRAYFLIQREYHAFRNGHYLIGTTFVMSLLLSLAFSPLSSRLFVEQERAVTHHTNLSQGSVFWLQLGIDTNPPWDLEPMFGITSATQTYGAAYPAWTDGKYAFRNFTIPPTPPATVGAANITALTNAYYASLDCRILNESQYTLKLFQDGLTIQATDRGCPWASFFTISSDYQTYVQTFNKEDCPLDEVSPLAANTRLVVISAEIENLKSHMSNLTVMSCIPQYWSRTGHLTLTIDPISVATIQDFARDSSTPSVIRPDWTNVFENEIQQSQSVDTTTSVSNGIYATSFGRMVLDHNHRFHPADYLDSRLIENATQAIFQTLFAVVVSSYMFIPAVTPGTTPASLSTITNRLFVFDVVADVLIGAFCVIIVLLLLMHFYAGKHSSALFEEPAGLVGQAGVLSGSEVNRLVAQAKEEPDFDGNTIKAVAKDLRERCLHERKFQMIDSSNPAKAKIEMTRLDSKGRDPIDVLFERT